MDFIENFFTASPNGVSIAFGIFLIALPIVLLASIVYDRKRRQRPPR